MDIGVAHDFGPIAGLMNRKLISTRNMVHGEAMDRRTAEEALEIGIELASEAVEEGVTLIGTGEMGIGNTTASAAIAAVMTGASVEQVTGLGTGIDELGRTRKISVIERALALHEPNADDPVDVVATIGGLEIAGMAGLMLGAAAARIPVVLDGFIAGAAALIAAGLQPRCVQYMIASHRSVERGHRLVLENWVWSSYSTWIFDSGKAPSLSWDEPLSGSRQSADGDGDVQRSGCLERNQ